MIILKKTATFQVVSLFCAWNITTMEINSGVHLLKSWSWSWSWSCYFGLGLKNLVLFTSLISSVINLDTLLRNQPLSS